MERKGRASRPHRHELPAAAGRFADGRNRALAQGGGSATPGRRRSRRAENRRARADPARARREEPSPRRSLASSRRAHRPVTPCVVTRAGIPPPPPSRCWSRLRAQNLSRRRREGEAAGKKGVRPGCVSDGVGGFRQGSPGSRDPGGGEREESLEPVAFCRLGVPLLVEVFSPSPQFRRARSAPRLHGRPRRPSPRAVRCPQARVRCLPRYLGGAGMFMRPQCRSILGVTLQVQPPNQAPRASRFCLF